MLHTNRNREAARDTFITTPLRLVAIVMFMTLAGCGGSGSGSDGGEPTVDARTYRMGFFFVSPMPTTDSLLATVSAMSPVAEVVLLQEAPPWERLLDGEDPADIATEKIAARDYVESLGMDLVYLVDPLDGLDRQSEAPELTDLGRSIKEPAIRALHEEWVRAVAETVQPEWLGLASEINTLGQHGDPALYAELVDMINGLVPEIHARAPGTKVFVSFQVEDAHGLIVPSDGEGFDLIDDFDIDMLGLSSYPVFNFETPADIPNDHLSRFAEETDLPLAMVEGGWSSEDTTWADSDSAEQVAYIERYSVLLDGIDARMWVMLTYADLNVSSYGLTPDREATLLNFGRMGIVDQDLNPKPSFEPWDKVHSHPLSP